MSRKKAHQQRRVLVTGATSGIGAAVAARMAQDGVALVLLGRDENRLRAVSAKLGKRASIETHVVDLSEAQRLPQRMDGIARLISSLDAVVHAAGYFIGGSVLQEDRAAIDAMLQVNVHAPLTVTRALLPLLERSRGTLVFINSSGIHRPARITANYMACKHALRSLTDSLREEVNARGVRVTTIYPGRTATPMQQALHTMEGRPYHPETLLQPEDVANAIASAIALAPSAELVDVLVRPMMSSVPSKPRAARSVRRPRRPGVEK